MKGRKGVENKKKGIVERNVRFFFHIGLSFFFLRWANGFTARSSFFFFVVKDRNTAN